MKAKQRILLVLVVVFAFSIATLCFSVFSANANSFRLEGTALKAEYATGETVEIPDLYFTADGGEVKATKTIIYPSGNAYSKDEIVPEEMGLYTVEYTAKNGATILYNVQTFYVYKPYYEVKGTESSSVEYKAYKNTPNHKALNVSIDEKSTFICNEMIDVTNLGADNKLISLYMTPENPGVLEAGQLIIRLTDAYDEKNYVEVKAYASTDGIRHGIAYISAGATSQRAGGFTSEGGEFYSAGTYGTPTKFNFWAVNYYGLGQGDGSYSEDYLVNNKYQLFFDYQEKQMKTLFHSTGKVFTIADFDDPALFTNVWDGFTTGEVILSIRALDFETSNINFAIDYIGGKDVKETKLFDTDKPTLTVEQEGVAPVAVVNVPYPVFKATAFDRMDGEVKVDTKVYRINGSTKADYNVVDGCFIPTVSGQYVIEYIAKDRSGNVQEETVNVECQNTSPTINIFVEQSQVVSMGKTGELIKVADATTSGGSGQPVLTCAVYDDSLNPVTVKDGYFRPTKAGVYSVEYLSIDYLSKSTKFSYNITVTDGSDPVFQETPTFLKYYVSDREYILPEYVAYNYVNGEQIKAEVQITVVDEQGSRVLASDRKVNFKESTVGTATITYKASESVQETFEINVRSVKEGNIAYDMSKYFNTLTGNVTSSMVQVNEETKITGITATTDGKVEFINALITDSFEMQFSVDSSKTKFSKLNIYLTDSLDSSKVLKFTYRSISDAQAVYSVNNGIEYSVGSGFTFAGNAYKLMINEGIKKVSGDGVSWIAPNKFLDGTDFNGFPSSKAFLSIEFEGVSDESVVRISSINAQVMQLVALDRVKPTVVVPGVDDGSKKIGDSVVIKPAIAGDVIDQCPIVTLSVKNPDGTFAKSKDNVELKYVSADREYVLELNEYGGYVITYTAKDFSNRETLKIITVNIRDEVAPTITLENANVTEATVGSTISIAKATYKDNSSPDDKLLAMTFVVTPNGKAINVQETSFVANEVGVYGIRYMVYDQEGNLTIHEDKIVVYNEKPNSDTESKDNANGGN